MRCSSPGVPGTAHGRTSRSSRWYGQERRPPVRAPLGVGASTGIGGSSAASGMRHGSAPLAR